MQSWEQTYEMKVKGEVLIEQYDGSVQIVGWERPEVQAKGSWPGEGSIEDRLDITVTAHKISLTVKPYRSGFLGLSRDSLLDLELSVPMGTRCQVESVSGPVAVTDTLGPVQIEAGSGRVQVAGLSAAKIEAGSGSVQVRVVDGPVEVETGSGRIDLEMVTGPVNLDTGSGSIAARRIGNGLTADTASGSIAVADVEGRVRLDTGSGSITVNRIASSEMSVDSGSGSIRMQGLDVRSLVLDTGSGGAEVELLRIHPDGNYLLDSGSGRLTLAVPPDAGMRLELETSGRIDYGGLPVQVLRQDDDGVSAVMGQGGPRVRVVSGSGSITLRPSEGSKETPESEAAVARLTEMVKDDPALEQSQQLARILQMVEEGKITTEEAEQVLRALDGEAG